MPHDGVAEDFAPSTFDVARLQAIAALDVRCFNSDRNAANLLVPSNKKKDIRLVPIDHGFCTRSALHRVVRLVLDRLEGCERAGRSEGQGVDTVVGRGEGRDGAARRFGVATEVVAAVDSCDETIAEGCPCWA